MSSYWDDEPYYYEPSEADEIFLEAKSKLENALKESIKNKMEQILEENTSLKEENQKMREKVREIEWKEKSLESKEKDLERSVLCKKFSEMLKPLEEKTPMYNVDYKWVYGDKCNKCNENRQIEYTLPSGKRGYEDCTCKKSYVVYYPVLREVVSLSLYKSKDYPYKISVTPKYDSPSYDDTYCHFELKTYIENLDETYDLKELYYKSVGFKTEEDCQKLCDYLNKKEKVPKKVMAKTKTVVVTEDSDEDWE